ncbi:hypothetical protein [Roseateles chitosanitabidus]|uniref:hypothetical protein n=1 Tax=Roseateles chitosanitabidus TaxID=65048 RepID=UPI00083046A2|nr:hypothetical protein [Roseateles chitosanitabidus]MBO9686131.1 hypothetical protein [Roseateles chitosanitabidus]
MRVADLPVVHGGSGVGLFLRDGRYELRVPHGMTALSSREAIALLFKTFVVFRRTRRDVRRLRPRDGVEQRPTGQDAGEDGVSFCDALAFDELFDRVDPRSLLSLCERAARLDHGLPARFERHLHLALFDERGTAHFERVPGTRRAARHGQADIVGLYCVLAQDFYRNLLGVDPVCGWGAFASEGEALADDFRHRHLTPEDSLFQDDASASDRSREQFRHLLAVIDRASPVRDAVYRDLHDALDRYLHAGPVPDERHRTPDGQVWGVGDFWAVWESICLVHALDQDIDAERLPSLWTCDHEHLPRGLADDALKRDWEHRRDQVFARNEIRRRPDLVRTTGEGWLIADFKYQARPQTQRPKFADEGELTKAERDFLNLEAYGLLLRVHLLTPPVQVDHRVRLEMWLPGESSELRHMPGTPRWDPPLSIRHLATRPALERYGRLYGR